MIPDERPMFLLGPIAAVLRWLEELLNLLSGPLLALGAIIAVIDLTTDGRLTATYPLLLYLFAISQAVGVEMQLTGAWDRARHALAQRHWGALVGQALLGLLLGGIVYVGLYAYLGEQSFHLTTAQALTALGVSAHFWLFLRAGIAIFLVALSAWTRYRTPRQTTLEDEQEKLQRELTLEPLRQRVRGVKLAGVRAAATALVGSPAPQSATPSDMPASASTMAATARDDGEGTTLPDNAYVSPAGSYAVVQHASDGVGSDPLPDDTPSPTPPTGPGSPVTAPPSRTRRQRTPSQPAASLRLVPDRDSLRQQRQQRQAAQGNTQGSAPVRTPGQNDSLEVVARQAFANGATSKRKMQSVTGMGASAAASWVRTLKAEQAATTGAPNAGQRIMPPPQLPLPGEAFRGVLSDDASAEAGEGYAL